MAWRSFRWSTVICRISAFSSLDEPCREKEDVTVVASDLRKPLPYFTALKEIDGESRRPCLSAHLFLKGTGHQPPELGQAVVDPVSAPLLYDLRGDNGRGTVRADLKRQHEKDPKDPKDPRLRSAHPSSLLPGQNLRGAARRHGPRDWAVPERQRQRKADEGRTVLAQRETRQL